jgi:HEPN domain-containing protein
LGGGPGEMALGTGARRARPRVAVAHTSEREWHRVGAMKFNGEEYYRAGIERMRQAREIHGSGGNYALAMYLSGLAVECLLRAFRWDEDKSFEGRHDLEDLLGASKLLGIDEGHLRKKGRVDEEEVRQSGVALRAAMSEVIILWHNNLRFASETSLRAFLRRIGRLQGVKGDPLKKNSSDLLNAAQTVMDRGVVLWSSKKK